MAAGDPRGSFISINRSAVTQIMNTQGRAYLNKVGEEIRKKASEKAPVGEKDSPEGGGRLKDSIEVRSFIGSSGPVVFIGSKLKRAFWIRAGVEEHPIPKTGETRMYFFWKKIGRYVMLKKVKHPGITEEKTNDFLGDALKEVLGSIR